MSASARQSLAEAVRGSGLISPESGGIVLVSGGPDSACLAAGLAFHCDASRLTALHLNYGLRPDSDQDEATCVELCAELGIELEVERKDLSSRSGNLQAAAREVRYGQAELLAERTGSDWIATGHTRSDLAETILYRLAGSPGTRALLGLPPRRGRIVRPLLGLGRDQTRALAAEADLPFRDDPSNLDPAYARTRIRNEVLPVLRELNPAVEQNIAETRAQLAEEAEALDAAAQELLSASADVRFGRGAVDAGRLAAAPAAVRRIALRQLAEAVAGRAVPVDRKTAAAILRLAAQPEGGEVDLGGGLTALCEHGLVRVVAGAEQAPEPARLGVPGSCRLGQWLVHAELHDPPVEPMGPEIATLDADALGDELEVRTWREGDRMRPLGLGGAKTLQDLFSDRHVPRSLRRSLPVVVSGETIAWVAGVAVSEELKLTPSTRRVAVLDARIAEAQRTSGRGE